jgi:hypothetical protein
VAATTYDTSYWCRYVAHTFGPEDSTVNAGLIWISACKTQP